VTAPGRFITFEGGEGAGKTTQIARLAECLRSEGHDVLTTREPGGTPTAERLRDVLLDREVDLGPMEEVLLFYAARRHHVDRLIRPAMAAGKTVLCDRFSDSTMAYQGAAGGIDRSRIEQIHRLTLGGFVPDRTVILDLPAEEGLRRASRRGGGGDRFEDRDLAFHQRLRDAFLEIAREAPGRCVVIDGARSEDEVAAEIRERLARKAVA
jgi:dTMP kinase